MLLSGVHMYVIAALLVQYLLAYDFSWLFFQHRQSALSCNRYRIYCTYS